MGETPWLELVLTLRVRSMCSVNDVVAVATNEESRDSATK